MDMTKQVILNDWLPCSGSTAFETRLMSHSTSKSIGHPMDDAENIARGFLESCGFTNVIYEPAGNVPPEFLV